MVSYSTGASALMVLTGLVNAAERIPSRLITEKKHLREAHTQQERRAQYAPDMETDKDTKCQKVIEGNPEVCIIVCTEVTSISFASKLLDETSTTSQRECEDGWQNYGHSEDPTYSPSTWFPTYAPTSPLSGDADEETDTTPWIGDGHTARPTLLPTISFVWKDDGHERVADWEDDGWDGSSSSSKDAWGPSLKCISKSNKSWSAPGWSGSAKTITSIDEWVPGLDSPPSDPASSSGSSGKTGKSGGGSSGSSGKTGKSGGGGSGKTGKSGGGGKAGKSGGRNLQEGSKGGRPVSRKLFWPFSDWAAATPDAWSAPVTPEDNAWVGSEPQRSDPSEPSDPSDLSDPSSPSSPSGKSGKSGGGGSGKSGKSGGGGNTSSGSSYKGKGGKSGGGDSSSSATSYGSGSTSYRGKGGKSSAPSSPSSTNSSTNSMTSSFTHESSKSSLRSNNAPTICNRSHGGRRAS